MLTCNVKYADPQKQIIKELLASPLKAVIFLNDNLEIVQVNNIAKKKFRLNLDSTTNFLFFSQMNKLKNNYYFSKDIGESIKNIFLTTLSPKIRFKTQPISWKVEYFPEFNSNGVKLGLIEICEEPTPPVQDPFCQSIYERVTEMVDRSQDTTAVYSVLKNIIHLLPGRAHLKKATDFSYVMTNAATLKLLGMNDESQLIGMNDYSVAQHMRSHWPAKLAEELQEIDQGVIHGRKPLIGKEETPYLDANGNLVIHSLTKIPIFDLNNEPLAILTLAVEITQLKDLNYLRNAYQNLYLCSKKAHYRFIEHIGLDKAHAPGEQLISIRELDCLILFTRGMTAKEIGRKLGISHRTVEAHLETIKVKFNCSKRSEIISLFLSHTGILSARY